MEKKKVLLVATVQSHICQFHLPLIDLLHEKGYEVHVAAKNNLKEKRGLKLERADKVFEVPFERSPFKKQNITAYKMLKKIINENHYNIIHCNTPMGGVLSRLAGKKERKQGTKIIYTAHGFHFFKGAPLKNWMIYYPIEKYLSKYTDCIITMNQEDYKIASKKFKKTNVEYTHGVGVRTEKFNISLNNKEKEHLRKKLNLKSEDFVIIYVAEMTKRKNHIMLLKCMKELIKEKQNIKLLLAGNGPLQQEYKEWIQDNNLKNNIQLLGYRPDIPQLMQISDIGVSTSKQEGLPVNVMEMMLSNLPIIVTNCRGNNDLIKDNKNGYVVEIDDIISLKEKILKLYSDKELCKTMGKQAKIEVQPYLLENVIKEINEIYIKVVNKNEK